MSNANTQLEIDRCLCQVLFLAANMIQTTIPKHFAPTRPRDAPASIITFFHLPFNLGRQIYAFAGLPGGLDVCLNYCPPDNNCPETLRGYRPGLNYLPSEEECPEIYLAPYNRYALPWEVTRSESLLYFLVDLFPHPAPLVERICKSCHFVGLDATCSCEPLPFQLLFVSQTVQDEIRGKFFSETNFIIGRSELGGLSAIFSFTQKAFSQLISLSIRLNACECTYDHLYLTTDLCECESCWNAQEEVLEKSNIFGKMTSAEYSHTMTEWSRLCSLIATSINPDWLRLSIACNRKNLEFATEVVRPLLQVPKLKEYAIRLGGHGYSRLGQLATDTVQKLTSNSTNLQQQTFPFMKLPKEIQCQILQNTELVSRNDLVWLPRGGPTSGRTVEYRSLDFDPIGSASNVAANAPISWKLVAAGLNMLPLRLHALVGNCQWQFC